MKRFVWLLLLIFISNLLPVNIFAAELSNSTGDSVSKNISNKATAIEKFRDKEKQIIDDIYNNTSFGAMMDVNQAKQQLDILSSDFKTILDQFNEVKDKKDTLDQKYNEIRQEITSVVTDINNAKQIVSDRVLKIRIYTQRLSELKESLEIIKADIDETKANLIRYTNFLYKINNDFYGKDFNIDDIKLLVKSDNIADSLSNEDIVKSLTVKMDELLEVMNKKQDTYMEYTNQLNELRVKYKYEVIQYQRDIQNFNEQKRYLLELFKYMRANKDELDQKYDFLIKNKEQLKDQIIDLVSMSKNRQDILKAQGGVDVTKLMAMEDKEDSDKFIGWPIMGAKRITAFFHDENYIKKMGTDHQAIDIAVPQGTEVYAPADAVVYKAIDQDGPDINRIILLHKNGYITIYIHMYKVLVKQGDTVERGQLIGLSGGQPGTRGAGLLSTGPHLHFNVIKNGENIDPLSVMDLSMLPSKINLPEEYQLKYLKDKYSRKIDLTQIKVMPGSTTQERRINFLKKFGMGPFANVALWEDASEDYGVDIDLGICIGYAETGLGWNTTTAWNVGNVGNNDRGDRVASDGALIGAKSIYATVANKYLSKHHTLDKLSRYGNDEGAIYASSDYNWQKNIVKCLTTIKGYQVPDEYAFRKYVEEKK